MESIIKDSPTKTRRKFDKSFKCEVVRNWLSSGKSAAVIAKEFGLNESLLFAWRKLLPPPKLGEGGGGGRRPAVEDLQSQLDAARREIRHLHEQRDILKKRWAFSPNRPGTLRTGSRDEIRPFHRDALRQPQGFAQRFL